jgi:branched-chain amino acid transport system ATP-binding protein
VAIIGPNGAGKSTLFNLISGRFEPTSGDVLLNGQRINGMKPFEINRWAVAQLPDHQHLPQAQRVREPALRRAVEPGLQVHLPEVSGRPGRCQRAREELMEMIKLDKKRDVLAMNLTYAEQRALEIGITIAGGANVILLDEPTAGMSKSETTRFIT